VNPFRSPILLWAVNLWPKYSSSKLMQVLVLFHFLLYLAFQNIRQLKRNSMTLHHLGRRGWIIPCRASCPKKKAHDAEANEGNLGAMHATLILRMVRSLAPTRKNKHSKRVARISESMLHFNHCHQPQYSIGEGTDKELMCLPKEQSVARSVGYTPLPSK